MLVPEYAQAALDAGIDTSALTIGGFFGGNLLPVTIGNMIGGLAVAAVYHTVYLRRSAETKV